MTGLDPTDAVGLDEPMGGRRLASVAAAVVGVVLVVFIGVLATRPSGEERAAASPVVGEPVPAVVGTTLDGEAYDIDDRRGRWVVVNFFATWCVPCRAEHPELVAFSEAQAASGDAEVVSIVFGDDPAAARAFFEQAGGDWPVLGGDDGALALAFGVTGVPESYVVSPEGRVVAQFHGVTQAGLDEVIARASGGAS